MFDCMLWTVNAAGQPCKPLAEVSNADLLIIMGTSLSGLTIDQLAHKAASVQTPEGRGIPRMVFDLGRAPVDSINSNYGGWQEGKDCFVQGPLDSNILEIIF